MSSDLYPVEITIENLYCFKGKQTLKLDATVYAVLAEADDNPARSNWLGKSTFLMAFAFVLNGWHTKRTDDEIVSRGESETRVKLVLNDKSVIERVKKHGKSMQIKFTAPGKRVITQARAQEAIDKHIGVTADDFFATHFFEQKCIGKLVTARSAERLSIVEGWLTEELWPVQQLHVAACAELTLRKAAATKLEVEHDEIEKDWQELLVAVAPVGTPDGFDLVSAVQERETVAQATYKAAQVALEAAVTAQAGVVRAQCLAARLADYDATVAEGLKVRKEFDALPAGLAESLDEVRVRHDGAKSEVTLAQNEKSQLVTVSFGGDCPVVGRPCPSACWVREQGASPVALAANQKRLQEATRVEQTVRGEAYAALEEVRLHTRLDNRLTVLRAKAGQLQEDAEAGRKLADGAVEEPNEDPVVAAQEALEHAGTVSQEAFDDRKWVVSAVDRVKVLIPEHVKAQALVELAVEAVEITGKGGAQQAIQELVLAQVELHANQLLSDASIPLQLSVAWEHETKGLAKVCECGTAFPTSQRVKVCTACGAARGPNVQRKLSIELSNRSGAAEDLAGIALGIAASQWLKAQRGVRWSTVFIDEPFGTLDQHNRQALGIHIANMLKASYSSAFVVAHERSILDAMPARVNIVAAEGWSHLQGAA